MNLTPIPLAKTQAFGKLFLDYLHLASHLKPFFQNSPSLQSFDSQIKKRSIFASYKRKLLHQTLCQQYATLPNIPQTQINLLLQDNTFTICTGHQPCLLTGPLYFIYKIITTIRLAEELKKQYPDFHFIPIYWLASEDHDFEEVNHFRLFGKKYIWQTQQQGATGRMKLHELAPLWVELEGKIAPELLAKLRYFYTQSQTLAEATHRLVHELFGQKGLLCLNADNPELKSLIKPLIKADIFEQKTFEITQQTTQELEKLGYKTQVQARKINFFYLTEQSRKRIVQEGNIFQVLGTDYRFSAEEISQEIENHPERFSPNVVLRPLYQETILPNLAYVSGPNELAYWLQFMPTFEHYQVPFPILLPRNFATILTKNQVQKIEKLRLHIVDFFQAEHLLKQQFIKQNASQEISLAQESAILAGVYEQILAKALQIEKSLENAVKAEKHKALQGISHLEKKLQRAEEKRQEIAIQQILGLKAKLFPEGDLQERKDNFLNFYANYPQFLEFLFQNLHPFRFEMHLLEL
ncbi:MAG: bacillithiol biosynthesis cysteine-adding enzyme BshC [Microscillaceae bacterium]|nr:bacillithiol biosynthesis cysteine-adding enzyme BshC [Microscillaceae bacterium]MDW8461791.1 bacillithiol biosynthesis cysteine-adding enzyme BshC [Cytophagales bacterium]